jgi:hypothetical protein
MMDATARYFPATGETAGKIFASAPKSPRPDRKFIAISIACAKFLTGAGRENIFPATGPSREAAGNCSGRAATAPKAHATDLAARVKINAGSVSAVGRRPPTPSRGSVGSVRAVRYAAADRLQVSDFPPRQRLRNNADAAAPYSLPCPPSMTSILQSLSRSRHENPNLRDRQRSLECRLRRRE